MNTTSNENDRIIAARESFSGRLLTDAQFDEAMAITGIIEREIKHSGAFKDKLGDYAYAFSRSERFDPAKSETILRDLFKERAGQTMNQVREGLMEREAKLTDDQKQGAYDYALGIGDLVENGIKISFNRAYAEQAQKLGRALDITDTGAKRLMVEEFKAVEEADLHEWGKELEERFYRPQIEAEKAGRAKSTERGKSDEDRTHERQSSESPERHSRATGQTSRDTESRGANRQRRPELRR